MNRNQLKYFVAAAESRSFTKAAEQFYISQTAITQQIRLLEEALGCPLFDRSTRPVSLTPAGTIFLREAKGILERMSRAQERVHDASTGLSGTLRVGYVRGYERSDLSAHIRQFHQQNSNVLITFYRCSTDALAAGLLHHEYDIIFTWDSTNLKTQGGRGLPHRGKGPVGGGAVRRTPAGPAAAAPAAGAAGRDHPLYVP